MELPVKLKTGDEMFEYTRDNGFGVGFSKGWGPKTFKYIATKMDADETAFLTFVGIHRFHSMSSHMRNFGYAITNKRILMGQVRSFNRTRFESVNLNQIMNIGIDNDKDIGLLRIYLESSTINVAMNNDQMNKLGHKLSELLPLIQELAGRPADADTDVELLDSGEEAELTDDE